MLSGPMLVGDPATANRSGFYDKTAGFLALTLPTD
jgi:hypothetical protein